MLLQVSVNGRTKNADLDFIANASTGGEFTLQVENSKTYKDQSLNRLIVTLKKSHISIPQSQLSTLRKIAYQGIMESL